MRFILLSHQRTGTTVFRTLVNQHPRTFMYGEVMNPDLHKWGWYWYLLCRIKEDDRAVIPTQYGRHFMKYLEERAEEKERAGKQIVGVDIKIPQIEQILDFFGHVKASSFGVLHLRRRNTLAAIVSHMTMMARKKRGQTAHGTKPADNQPIHLDMELLEFRIPHFELLDARVKRSFRDGKYLEIYYEDFTHPAGWQQTCGRLSEFFGMPFELAFTPTLKKQNSSNLADLIRNADEVRSTYPRFFDMDNAPAPPGAA